MNTLNAFEADPINVAAPELPPISRWKKVGMAAAGIGLGLSFVATTDAVIQSDCAKEDTAFSFNFSPDQCDGYVDFRNKITSIPDFRIVSEPIFNPDDLKLFSHDR